MSLDLQRLVQAVRDRNTRGGLARLANHELSRAAIAEAVSQPAPLFARANPQAPDAGMAVRAARPNAEPAAIAASFTTLVPELLAATGRRRIGNDDLS